jgi:hypothetical protein
MRTREPKNIFLKKDQNSVRVFYSEEELEAAGFTEADKIVTDDEFNANGCYAQIINGTIIVGKTDAQKAEDEEKELLAKLAEIDRLEGASRAIRETVKLLGDSAGLDTSKLMTHELEAISLRTQLEDIRKRKAA